MSRIKLIVHVMDKATQIDFSSAKLDKRIYFQIGSSDLDNLK